MRIRVVEGEKWKGAGALGIKMKYPGGLNF